MKWLVDPESIAFGSVDDDLAEGVARSMGWRSPRASMELGPVRLPTFGPRKIHSTPEITPDPLLDDDNFTPTTVSGWGMFPGVGQIIFSPSTAQWLSHSFGMAFTAYRIDDQVWPLYPTPTKPPTTYKGNRQGARTPKPAPQWDRPFYERRPTEPVKVGRPKRRRK